MRLMKPGCRFLIALAVLVGFCSGLRASAQATRSASDYVVVISSATMAMKEWSAVAEALKVKHGAEIVTVEGVGAQCKAALRQRQPRYVCFVARPEEIDGEYVRNIHILSRQMDDDPYIDFLWGIVTGATAEDALRVAQAKEPLFVRSALTLTGVNKDPLKQVLILSDTVQGHLSAKETLGPLTETRLAGFVMTDKGAVTWRAELANNAWSVWKKTAIQIATTNGTGSETTESVIDTLTVASNLWRSLLPAAQELGRKPWATPRPIRCSS